MAKPLNTTIPSSSVARLLDPSAASRALAVTQPTSVGVSPRHDHRPRQEVSTKREFVLSAAADETLTRLVESLRRATGTKLTASHALRALMQAIEPAIGRISHHHGTRLRLPSNAPNYEPQRARFAESLAAIVTVALAERRSDVS